MLHYEAPVDSVVQTKKALIDFIARTHALALYCEQMSQMPAHIFKAPQAIVQQQEALREPEIYKGFMVASFQNAVELGRHTINDTLQGLGGLACALHLPGETECKTYTLNMWSETGNLGQMSWKLQELGPAPISLDGRQLVNDLRTLQA
jgi:hypothetical protein